VSGVRRLSSSRSADEADAHRPRRRRRARVRAHTFPSAKEILTGLSPAQAAELTRQVRDRLVAYAIATWRDHSPARPGSSRRTLYEPPIYRSTASVVSVHASGATTRSADLRGRGVGHGQCTGPGTQTLRGRPGTGSSPTAARTCGCSPITRVSRFSRASGHLRRRACRTGAADSGASTVPGSRPAMRGDHLTCGRRLASPSSPGWLLATTRRGPAGKTGGAGGVCPGSAASGSFSLGGPPGLFRSACRAR